MNDNKQYCYLNGKIILASKAAIPISDISITRGFAIFDSMFASGAKVLHVEDHMNRFYNSAKEMGLRIPLSKKVLQNVMIKLLKKNGYSHSKVRALLTGGTTAKNAIEADPAHPNFFVTAEPFIPLAKAIYEKGVSLITINYQRPWPTVKTTNYMVAVRMQDERKRKKAFEILYTFEGQAFECSTSNFFLVKGSRLITAKNGVLKGITRKFVFKYAESLGLKVVEREVKVSEFKTADEAFITGTYKEIIPVIKIDAIKIGNGKVGHVAQELGKLYEDFVK
jgi:D-alanine transaminase/branched-chain amino acid aminotransferase